jgi:16S rRNA (adenine(1408)-N(1))-methyltransferase
VTIDVGTGDGRAVLAAAAREPTTLVLGLDANASAMAEASRRAARAARKGGLENARFVLAAAEALPPELCGVAARVSVLFPWGSLLRGCLGLDEAVARGVAGLVAPGGELELLLAPAERDGLEGVPTTEAEIVAAASHAFGPFGLEAVVARAATTTEVAATGSSWAKRLRRSPMLIRLARR